MPDKELVNYIKEQLKKGYDIYTVRQFLINSGYPEEDVDSAVDSAFKKTIPVSATAVIAVLVIVLLIGVGYLSFSLLKPTKTVLIETIEKPRILEQQPKQVEPTPGQPIEFGAGVSCADNIQNQDEVDIDCGGTCKPCGFGKSCRTNADCKSNYCFEGVCKISTCFDGIKNQDEMDVDCGGVCEQCRSTTELAAGKGTCFDKIRNQDEAGIDCGGTCRPCQFPPAGMTGSDVLAQIRTLSLTNAQQAEQQCREVVKSKPSLDSCFSILAETTNQSVYCAELISDSSKDSCYLSFMIAGDYSVCNRISDLSVADTCNSFSEKEKLSKLTSGS